MIVVMEPSAAESSIADVVERLTAAGCRVSRHDATRVTLAASGGAPCRDDVLTIAGVERVLAQGAVAHVEQPPITASNAAVPFARGALSFIAGPCSVEDESTMLEIAAAVKAAGATALRAGAYKPRSSPYSFGGAGEEGLVMLRRVADAHDLLVVSEVLDAAQIGIASCYCDVLQVGARNMYNSTMLRELGRGSKPVLLKRGLSATIDEWLNAAEYIASNGNERIMLCERGIRTFETATRNTLDLNAVAVVRARTALPVLVDPSHGIGLREHVPALALAAVAAGADGLLIEAHVQPEAALSDARQTIDVAVLGDLIARAHRVRAVLRHD